MAEITHEDILRAITEKGRVLVLLTAPAWCMPCRRFHSHWEMAKPLLSDVEFIEVDMGESPEDTQKHWAYELFDVRSVPTVLAFHLVKQGTVAQTRIEARAIVPFMKEVQEVFGIG